VISITIVSAISWVTPTNGQAASVHRACIFRALNAVPCDFRYRRHKTDMAGRPDDVCLRVERTCRSNQRLAVGLKQMKYLINVLPQTRVRIWQALSALRPENATARCKNLFDAGFGRNQRFTVSGRDRELYPFAAVAFWNRRGNAVAVCRIGFHGVVEQYRVAAF
jgi:hypothetical protein